METLYMNLIIIFFRPHKYLGSPSLKAVKQLYVLQMEDHFILLTVMKIVLFQMLDFKIINKNEPKPYILYINVRDPELRVFLSSISLF